MAEKQNNPGPEAGFAADFVQCWNQLPNKTFFLVLLGAWILLFQVLGNASFGYIATPSLFKWMWVAFNSGDQSDQHGVLIPPLVLILFWMKRRELLALPVRSWTPAIVLLALALLFHLVGYVVQQERISIVALFLGIYALIGLAWGPGWLRAGFFPFFLLAFCIPVSSIAEPVTFPMRLLVSKLVVWIANGILGLHVVREGTQLFNATHTYNYEVAAACSGLRSVITILCLGTIYGFLEFKSNWKRALLIVSAFPLSIAANVLRMLCIIVAAEMDGQETGNFVHENWFFSLVPYVPAIGGLLLLGSWLGRKSRQGREKPAEAAAP